MSTRTYPHLVRNSKLPCECQHVYPEIVNARPDRVVIAYTPSESATPLAAFTPLAPVCGCDIGSNPSVGMPVTNGGSVQASVTQFPFRVSQAQGEYGQGGRLCSNPFTPVSSVAMASQVCIQQRTQGPPIFYAFPVNMPGMVAEAEAASFPSTAVSPPNSDASVDDLEGRFDVHDLPVLKELENLSSFPADEVGTDAMDDLRTVATQWEAASGIAEAFDEQMDHEGARQVSHSPEILEELKCSSLLHSRESEGFSDLLFNEEALSILKSFPSGKAEWDGSSPEAWNVSTCERRARKTAMPEEVSQLELSAQEQISRIIGLDRSQINESICPLVYSSPYGSDTGGDSVMDDLDSRTLNNDSGHEGDGRMSNLVRTAECSASELESILITLPEQNSSSCDEPARAYTVEGQRSRAPEPSKLWTTRDYGRLSRLLRNYPYATQEAVMDLFPGRTQEEVFEFMTYYQPSALGKVKWHSEEEGTMSGVVDWHLWERRLRERREEGRRCYRGVRACDSRPNMFQN